MTQIFPLTLRALPAVGLRRPQQLLRLALRALHTLRHQGVLVVVVRIVVRVRAAVKVRRASHSPAVEPPILYSAWIAERESTAADLLVQEALSETFAVRPLISIILPVAESSRHSLSETIASITRQTYRHWELCLGVRGSDVAWVRDLVEDLPHDPRLRLEQVPPHLGASGRAIAALRIARGDFVAVWESGDLVARNALFEAVKVINEDPSLQLVYFDEDTLPPIGSHRYRPWFKPPWSPELLLSVNYLQHAVIRRGLIQAVGGFDPGMDGAHDWDLMLRCTEHTSRIAHIPKVLYHVRRRARGTANTDAPTPSSVELTQLMLRTHLERLDIEQPSAYLLPQGHARLSWPVRDVRVSIILRSERAMTAISESLASLFSSTSYPSYEVIVVHGGGDVPSHQHRAHTECDTAGHRLLIVPSHQPTSPAAAMTLGAEHARGEVLVFLADGIEAIDENWLQEMLMWALRPEIGAVGPKVLDPGGRLGSVGLIIGTGAPAARRLERGAEDHSDPHGSVDWYRNDLAVSGACLMMRRDVFNEVVGPVEDDARDLNDAELCLRVVERGYRVVHTPFARLRWVARRKRSELSSAPSRWHVTEPATRVAPAGDPYVNLHPHSGTQLPLFQAPQFWPTSPRTEASTATDG